MREEFHGNGTVWGETVTQWKLLYGWGTINARVWLPSLSELVGIISSQDAAIGCYFSAMQGINAADYYWADAQGGAQFAYLKQFNASGGGEAIMSACNQQQSWLRTSVCATAEHTWQVTNTQRFDWVTATVFRAVHPAVLYNPERPIKQTEIAVFI